MQYANVNGERREASPNAKGECPLCGSEVISKCGNIKIHHWAHVSGSECELGKEPESKEHLNGIDDFLVMLLCWE